MKKLNVTEQLLINEFLMFLYHNEMLEMEAEDKIIEGNQLEIIQKFIDQRR
jgi:hypothetical protein